MSKFAGSKYARLCVQTQNQANLTQLWHGCFFFCMKELQKAQALWHDAVTCHLSNKRAVRYITLQPRHCGNCRLSMAFRPAGLKFGLYLHLLECVPWFVTSACNQSGKSLNINQLARVYRLFDEFDLQSYYPFQPSDQWWRLDVLILLVQNMPDYVFKR